MELGGFFQADGPVIGVRAVHLDLKGVPPTPERLVDLLRVFAALRYNAVLVEWEDTFPWTVDERFRSETAYTPEQVERFGDAAAGLGIELIPLVQCLGHMETPLGTPGYEHLREVADRADVLNPLAAGARELVEGMVDDVLALMPGLTHFHLGGDEAESFGTHPDTKAFVEAHGKGALYLHHVEPILDKLNARGIRPMLWHDMMREWDGDALRRLGEKADLVVWGYDGHPAEMGGHVNREIVARFGEHGVPLWGAAAYKGADGHDVDLPNFDNRQANALGWAEFAADYKMKGVIATAWSRYNTLMVQCEPIAGALDSLANVAAILHDGQPPAGAREACIEALGAIGERERFEAARGALSKLTDVTAAGRAKVQEIADGLAAADDAGRPVAVRQALAALGRLLEQADAVGDEVRRALAGLIDDLWINGYLSERLAPLRQEFEKLEQYARDLPTASSDGRGGG